MMNSFDDKYKEVWKMLKKYSFNINPNNNRDLLCAICNKILVNVYQNECGCRFCYKCIKSYMKTNDKPCPGNTEECSKEIINENSIQADYTANKRLTAIPVKCPIETCSHIDCLINISSHLQSHTLDCPFALFGCCQSKYNADDIQCHLTEENSTHSKLLFEYINNVKIDLKSSQRIEINRIGKQFIELYETQERKIEKLELENEVFKKLNDKVANLESENEELRKLSKMVSQLQLEYEEFMKFQEMLARYQLESAEFRKIDEKVKQLQLESEKFREIDEKLEQIQMGNEKFRKIDEKIEQIQLECQKLKSTNNNNANNNSINEQNEMKKIVEKLTQTMDEMKKNIEQNNSSTKSSLNERKSVARNYSNSIPSNSKKIHENYKVKYEIICQQMSDLKKEMRSLQRVQKDMKYSLSDMKKVSDNSSYSEDISQLKKNLERYKMKEESNSKVISEEFYKLKRDLRNYLSEPDECAGKFQLINNELSEIKQTRDKIKFQFDKISIENQVIKDKLTAENEKLKDDIKKINDKFDNNVIKVQSGLENNLIDHKREIENFKAKCAEFDKINESFEKTVSQCQTGIGNATGNLNDLSRDLLLLSGDYDVTKSTNSASMEKFQKSQLEIELFIDNNIKKYIKSFENFPKMNDSIHRLKSELSKLRIDFSLSYKNLISDVDNVKTDLGARRSIDSKLQLQIANSNAEIAQISKNLINNQLDPSKLIKIIEDINLFRISLETFQKEIKGNREEIKSLKISQEKLSEEFNKIIGNWEKIDKIIRNSEKIDKIIGNQDKIDKIIGNWEKVDKIIRNWKKIDKIIGNQDQIDKINGNQDIINSTVEFQQMCHRKFNELLSSQNDIDKKQDEVAKEFLSMSKRFLNLRTECLNIKADIASQLAVKKTIQCREWTLENFSKKLQKSKTDEEFNVTSDWFQLAGYRMSFKVYPNGDSLCKNKFMSVFFFILKLQEFVEEKKKYRLTIVLVDRQNPTKNFTKEYDYYNYIKPEITVGNSHELGASNFISLDELRGNPGFIHNDSLMFRFIIKPS